MKAFLLCILRYVLIDIWIPHFFRLMLMCNTVKAVKKGDALFWHDFRYGHIAER